MNMINKNGKWNEIKAEIQKTWGLLTHDEVERAKGSLHSLAGTLQKKYGMARHEAIERLSQFVDRLSKSTHYPHSEAPKNEEPPMVQNPLDPNP